MRGKKEAETNRFQRIKGRKMRSRWHFLVTSVIALTVYSVSDNFVTFLLCFLFGYFIDADHEIDYYKNNGRITLSINELSHIREDLVKTDILIIPLHCIELIPLIYVVLYIIHPVYALASVSFALHLFMDYIQYKSEEKAIWLSGVYRIYAASLARR